MFGGLLADWVLFFIGFEKPLSLIHLIISFDILFSIFWLIAYIRNKDLAIEFKPLKLNSISNIFIFIPIILLALSIFGALVLNNNGSNTLTMIMLGGIAVYVLILIFLRNKVNENIYPWAILIISLAMLLATSLRSWHISGHDIKTEYQMFQLTKENFHWSMSNFPGNAYNACLSITLLPTILSLFLNINDEYIFKIFFQIIFCFISAGVFLFLKRYTKPLISFIAVLFFISFPTFFIDLPMMARQEISLFFFALILLILFDKQIKPTAKKIIFIIFGFSMIVSHYSTSYIAFALFLSTYILTLLFSRLENRKTIQRKLKHAKKLEYYLSGYLVLLLFVFGFLWYSPITHTSNGLIDFMNKSFRNLGNIFSEDVRVEQTSFLEQFNIFYKPKDKSILLQDYIKEAGLKYENVSYINYYLPEKYESYKPVEIPAELVPLRVSSNLSSNIYLFAETIKKSMKAFIIIGVIYLLFRVKDTEYKFLTLASLFWLVAIMILPFASIEYNLLRTYQQVLIILSLPVIPGSFVIFRFIKKENLMLSIVSIIFILYFLFYSGFIPQLIGGSEALLHLNNFGTYFDKYYTHESGIKSAKWLSDNYDNKYFIYVDSSTSSELKTFSDFKDGQFIYYILPSIIDRDAYVYLGYTNTVKKMITQSYNGAIMKYNFPAQSLNDNKNKIYNNGGSEIFN